MEILNYHVSDGQSGIRIDLYLSEKNEKLSRSYIQKLLKEQKIMVNGSPVKANYKVQDQDDISLEVPDMEEPDILPEDIPLDILYEDEDVLIVNKPKGMVVHPSAGHTSGTLVNAIMFHCKDNLSGINGVLRPGIVHRIDKDTTGALLVCKNDNAHRDLAEQLKEPSIKRRYRAIVAGVLKEDEGTIEGPIGRHPVDRKKMSINYKNGKDVTEHFSYEGCIVMCIESFLKQVPTKLIVETLEPVVLYMFPRDMLFKLAKENWEINMFYQKILEYSLIVSQIKADSWRFESARERYNLLLETHPEIIKRAPLAHIASYLLMTPETLSRVRSGVL